MVYKLFPKLTSLGLIAIALTLTSKVASWGTEYVFTAPPDAEQKALEIPSSETDYPLYECGEAENIEDTATDENTALDSHDCSCIDCEEGSPEASGKTLEGEASSLENSSSDRSQ